MSGSAKAARALCALALVLASAVAAAATPTLSFIRQAAGGNPEWLLWRAGQGQAQVVWQGAGAPPAVIFWGERGRQVWFAADGAVQRARVVPGRALVPRRVAALPGSPGELQALWVERGTGRLRVAYRLAVEAGSVEAGSDGAAARYRLPDGSSVPAPALPEWGLPFVIEVYEHDGRRWQRLARRATKDLAGDTPGLSVIDDLRHERGISNERLIASYGCDGGQCSAPPPPAGVRRLALAADAALHPDVPLAEDALAMPPAAQGPAVAFATLAGDRTHMRPPVVLVAPGGRTPPRVLDIGRRSQIVLGRQGRYLLVADEQGGRPMVFDLRSGERCFEAAQGRAAAWVPQ
jgi:hypothetical protein